MISVAPLAGGGSAEYYLDREAGCEADYYLDRDEAAGRWLGGGAAALELAGVLDERGAAAFRALLDGRDPISDAVLARPVWRAHPAGRLPGAPLVEAVHRVVAERGTSVPFVLGDDRLTATFAGVASAAERRPSMRSLDPRVAARVASAAGLEPVEVFRSSDGTDVFSPALERAGERYDDRNSGYDVCVSAPKSVSTLFALASPQTAATVSRAHATAVRTALAYLEREVGHGLRGHQGDGQRAARIGTDGFIAAAFAHRTSRENDPQLHTHVVVANLLHGDDGKWSAIDSRSLHRYATTASYIYQATLRGELTRELGVTWTSVDKGIAEIAGIPTDLMRAFSTRRAAIDNYLSVSGRDDPAAAQHACLATRPKKTHQTSTDLREQWATTARRLGHDPAKVLAAALEPGAPASVDLVSLVAELTGPSGLTRRKTTVDRRDVLQALCEALPAGTDVSLGYLDQLCEHVTRHRGVVETRHRGDDGPQFSTAELVATEQHALDTADVLRRSSTGYYSAVMSRRDTLTDEQRRLVTQLVYGDRQLAVVVGPAGSGKTAALSVAHRAWRSADIPVVGAAVAALAARGLQTATGIPSVTMTRLLADLDAIDPRTRRPAGFTFGTVVVVDEASMVDTRTLARLLDHVHESGARLVLVGDSEQLPEIEAGGLFRTLADHPDTHRLTANVRQHNDWERDALQALRTNRPAQALMAYVDHGRVRVDVPDALFVRLVNDYVDTAEAAPLRTVALAATRREVAALNAAVQLARLQRDLVSNGGVYVDVGGEPRGFHVGDVVVVTRNHREHGVLNGLRGQVTAINPHDGSVVMTDTDGIHYDLPNSLLAGGDVDHGYALTVHRAQGITVDTAFVFGTAALTKEAGYVALSRGRIANYLYASPQELKAAVRVDPFDDSASRLMRALDHMVDRLLISRRHHLASAQLPAAANRQRGPAFRHYEPVTRDARGLSR